ncbi:pantoate--beta-alanine ligase [Tuwongella immobilis]|uniref:pantoate--beta-alanine ligase n=1 Tax=Tuwongella immobilis TaxID=692036 RepID=UPI0013A69AF5
MPVIESVAELRQHLQRLRNQNRTIGFVPTMGALHDGHLQLIKVARKSCDVVVVSIFVNPLQFGPNEDLNRYPRTFASDVEQSAAAGASIVFAPTVPEMYPDGFETSVNLHRMGAILEGASRPGHFQGVATVVMKLFWMVLPDRAFFGQKDAQQVGVIQRMSRDMNIPIELIIVPTVREADGLALSSRNRYLSPTERQQAGILYQALSHAAERFQTGVTSADVLLYEIREIIGSVTLSRLDYAEIVDSQTFEPLERVDRPATIVLAVFFGSTRLIDNWLLTPSNSEADRA